ncbi:hypothetical protein QTO01_18230 [Vibrio mytili]|uniref:hypothetical protein n=1 Tax=Vibrio mytili TaxID=50718 RepID=UPI002F424A7D
MNKYKILRLLPLPKATKLNWIVSLTERDYRFGIGKVEQPEKVRELMDSCRWEVGLIQEELDYYLSQKILSKARKMRVPYPDADFDEDGQDKKQNWVDGHQTGYRFLSAKGYAEVRSGIRTELKERRELRSHWVVWLSAFTGLVGAITGLIAVIGSNG